MKVLEVIKKVVMGILIGVFYLFALVMTILLLNFNDYGITELNGNSLVIIKDKIANTKYKKGDVVVVENQRYDNLKIGDEIFAYRVNSKGNVEIEIGVIGELLPNDLAVSFENGIIFEEKYIIGTHSKTIPNIGGILGLLESKWGFLFAVLVPSFVIFIHQVYNLIVEIKYGSNDEDEEKKS